MQIVFVDSDGLPNASYGRMGGDLKINRNDEEEGDSFYSYNWINSVYLQIRYRQMHSIWNVGSISEAVQIDAIQANPLES